MSLNKMIENLRSNIERIILQDPSCNGIDELDFYFSNFEYAHNRELKMESEIRLNLDFSTILEINNYLVSEFNVHYYDVRVNFSFMSASAFDPIPMYKLGILVDRIPEYIMKYMIDEKRDRYKTKIAYLIEKMKIKDIIDLFRRNKYEYRFYSEDDIILIDIKEESIRVVIIGDFSGNILTIKEVDI